MNNLNDFFWFANGRTVAPSMRGTLQTADCKQSRELDTAEECCFSIEPHASSNFICTIHREKNHIFNCCDDFCYCLTDIHQG